MNTQPPSNEAVEAVRKWVAETPWKLPQETCIRSFTQVGYWALPEEKLEAAARILDAEVERLRAQSDAVCEWTYNEYYRDHDGAEVGLNDWPYSSQCGETHTAEHGSYCPACGRKVKIQPQTNDA